MGVGGQLREAPVTDDETPEQARAREQDEREREELRRAHLAFADDCVAEERDRERRWGLTRYDE